jgi:hypothetical protein
MLYMFPFMFSGTKEGISELNTPIPLGCGDMRPSSYGSPEYYSNNRKFKGYMRENRRFNSFNKKKR